MSADVRTIAMTIGGVGIDVDLDASATADAVLAAVPFRAVAHRWGDEIYFDVPIEIAQAPDARQDMEVGEFAYWPAGPALCLFFGPTPVSTGREPRAYSPVNPCGRVRGDASLLTAAREGDPIVVTRSGHED